VKNYKNDVSRSFYRELRRVTSHNIPIRNIGGVELRLSTAGEDFVNAQS
jgi:hypothetical protein